jgi:TetR/AcrR family transcriptional regulator, transcriptional repressor for nem operon
MKVSKEQAEQNRKALLEAASRLYREHGFDGVGVAQIAREAGLTHGSLYGHFQSKDHYAAEACAHAFVKGVELLGQVEAGDDAALAGFFQHYLSEAHRDAVSDGCPIAALATDAARKDGPVGETMTRGIETYVELFTERFAKDENVRERAMTTLSMLVGGLILSRASAASNAALSQQLLTSVLQALGAPRA